MISFDPRLTFVYGTPLENAYRFISMAESKKKAGVTAEHLSSGEVLPEDAIQGTSEKSFHELFRGAHLLSLPLPAAA